MNEDFSNFSCSCDKLKLFSSYKHGNNNSIRVASKKGIVLTTSILIAITGISFVVWFIPENNQISFVVSDFESNLDNVKEIHNVISEKLDEDFQKVLNGEMPPEQYIKIARVSSSQINSQIIQLIESQATSKWEESYFRYIESLKQFNSYIRETIVIANIISETSESDIGESLEKLSQMKGEVAVLVELSDNSRP